MSKVDKEAGNLRKTSWRSWS